MEISIRMMTLKLFIADGVTQEKPTTIIGDDEHVQWVAEQYADVNGCGATISNEQGTVIGKAGNVPKPISLNGHTMSIYAQAVEADRLFTEEMMKTMTPEQINRFCFENGYAVPEPKEQK